MLRRQALSALPQGCNVPATLGLFRRVQREPHAACQAGPQPRQDLSAKRLSRQASTSVEFTITALQQPMQRMQGTGPYGEHILTAHMAVPCGELAPSLRTILCACEALAVTWRGR